MAAEVDVTGQVTLIRGGYIFNRVTNTFDSTVTLTNIGMPLPARTYVIVTTIVPSTVSVKDATGQTPNALPIVDVPLATGGLATGQTAQVVLKFSNPMRVAFSYSLAVFGSGIEDIGRTVSFEGPTPVSQAALDKLPKNPETGNPILIQLPEGTLELDLGRRDAYTALSQCVDWVLSCYKAGDRNIDDCARSVPKCQTYTPWHETACCPSACFDKYRSARLSGQSHDQAFMETYRVSACFPK